MACWPAAPGGAELYIKGDARKVWNEITESRPPHYFKRGSLQLLEVFVMVSAALRKVTPKVLAANPLSDEGKRLTEVTAKLASVQTSMAVRVRLAVSSSVRAEVGELKESGMAPRPLLGVRSN